MPFIDRARTNRCPSPKGFLAERLHRLRDQRAFKRGQIAMACQHCIALDPGIDKSNIAARPNETDCITTVCRKAVPFCVVNDNRTG